MFNWHLAFEFGRMKQEEALRQAEEERLLRQGRQGEGPRRLGMVLMVLAGLSFVMLLTWRA